MSIARAGAQGHAPKVIVEKAPEKKKVKLTPVKENGDGSVEYKVSREEIEALFDLTEEQKKYLKCWDVPDYRKYSPGEQLVRHFLSHANPEKGETIVDWGCGTGRAAKAFHDYGLDVTAVDFANNCMDDEVRAELCGSFRFVDQDLTKPCNIKGTFGFCTDVLEHIPESDVDQVLDTILNNTIHVYFQISCLKDHFGGHPDIAVDGERQVLHHTCHGYQWWLKKFVQHGVIVHHSQDLQNSVIFYVTGHKQIDLRKLLGTVNISDEEILDNMRENAKLGYQQLKCYEPQEDVEVIVLAGGPSINEFEDEIREKRESGMPLVTMNGSYLWAIERGLKPSLQCVIDGRECNHRFVDPTEGVTDETKYIIASQCHPEVLKKCPKDRTFLWQVSIGPREVELANELFGKMHEDWFPVPGGSTVALRTLCALQMLGFRKFHVYGLDSCLPPEGDEHHGYPQPENDHQIGKDIPVTLGEGTEYEKKFRCTAWHVFQARDFEGMANRVLTDCDMIVYGDGLIASALRMAAEMPDDDVLADLPAPTNEED